jgi:ribosome-binding protein aMBF1 (putative translation factor)
MKFYEYFENQLASNAGKRAFAARLDRALKRAGVSSTRVASWLEVSESDVKFWRDGVLLPAPRQCTRLANNLNLDVHWLCAGDMVAA